MHCLKIGDDLKMPNFRHSAFITKYVSPPDIFRQKIQYESLSYKGDKSVKEIHIHTYYICKIYKHNITKKKRSLGNKQQRKFKFTYIINVSQEHSLNIKVHTKLNK